MPNEGRGMRMLMLSEGRGILLSSGSATLICTESCTERHDHDLRSVSLLLSGRIRTATVMLTPAGAAPRGAADAGAAALEEAAMASASFSSKVGCH